MLKGKVRVIFLTLSTSAKELRIREGGTMCAPSGRAMNGRRCHDEGMTRGVDFDFEEVVLVGEEGGLSGRGVAGRGG
jgi:hypothetical protein